MTKVISNNGVDVRVEPGQVYVFTANAQTRAGEVFLCGARLLVEYSTTEPSFGEISESGLNWGCRSHLGVSVWARSNRSSENNV